MSHTEQNPESEHHPLGEATQTAAVLAGPALSVAAAAHELEANGWVSRL